MKAEKLARKLLEDTQNFEKEDLELLQGVIDFRKASADLKPLILSLIVPTNVNDDNERPNFGITIANGDNQLRIGYVSNKKALWRDILLTIGKYYSIDFSDVLNSEGNFKRTFDENGCLQPDSEDYDPRYVNCDKASGQLLTDMEEPEVIEDSECEACTIDTEGATE